MHSSASSSCPPAASWHRTGTAPLDTHPLLEARIAVLINAFRRAHGLVELRSSANLAAAARYHSADMHARRYFAHERAGETFEARLERYSPASCIAENLAWGTGGFAGAAGVVSLWRSSPEHRHVMLLPWLRLVGVGVVGGTFYGQPHARITTADFAG